MLILANIDYLNACWSFFVFVKLQFIKCFFKKFLPLMSFAHNLISLHHFMWCRDCLNSTCYIVIVSISEQKASLLFGSGLKSYKTCKTSSIYSAVAGRVWLVLE